MSDTEFSCRGHHHQASLDWLMHGAWLLLCSGCEETSLVLGSRHHSTYPSRIDAEAALLLLVANTKKEE